MDSTISIEELNCAMKKLKQKKSQGPDGITNEMLINVGKLVLYKLLEIFNKICQKGSPPPQSWREATMTPIYKKGNLKQNPQATDPSASQVA